jgi:hypothetical protein
MKFNGDLLPSAAQRSELHIGLDASPEQLTRLANLQGAFAQVCNALAPIVQQTRCWNRVTLHHLAYRQLRDKFPAIGSQMVCNAIYSVSRTSRIVFQHPASPFNVQRLNGRALPLLRFTGSSPVYFDRHTLSLKDGRLSLYTLDGRIRFDLPVRQEHELAFDDRKVREIALMRTASGGFELCFRFAQDEKAEAAAAIARPAHLPDYVVIEEAA